MAVVIVDDDVKTIEMLDVAFRDEGFDVLTALCGSDAVALCTTLRPSVAVIDLRLPDISGTEVLRALQTARANTRVVIVTGHGTVETAVEAMRLGACDYIEKPIDLEHLIRVVRALSIDATSSSDLGKIHVCHAAARWAALVVRVIDSPDDPKTVSGWARWIAVSPGALRNWCRTAGVPSKRSLDFARVLRGVARRATTDEPQDLLDVADRRTLAYLLRLGRSTSAKHDLPETVDEYLRQQRWVTSGNTLRELQIALNTRYGNRSPRVSMATSECTD